MTRTPPPPVTRCHVLRRLMASSSRRIYRNGVIVMSSLMMKTKLLIEKNGVPMKEKKLVTPQDLPCPCMLSMLCKLLIPMETRCFT